MQGALAAVEAKKDQNGHRGKVTVAATQYAISWDMKANVDKAEELVRKVKYQPAKLEILFRFFRFPFQLIRVSISVVQVGIIN